MRDSCWAPLLSSRFDNLLIFSVPSCSQKAINQGCALAPVPPGAFCQCQWKYLMTLWGDYSLPSSPQRSPPVCSTPVLMETSQFASPWIPFGWWLHPDGPLSWRHSGSALITLHMQSIASISWSAWSKPNYITACGTGTHRPPSYYDNHVPLEAGQNFCSLGNRPMQKWWNCSAHSHSLPWLGKAVPPPVAHTALGTTLHACGTGVSASYIFCSMEYL